MRIRRLSYGWIFRISVCLIISFTVLCLILLYQTQSDRYWMEHRRKMQTELDGVLASTFEMESTHRGMLLTGDSSVARTFRIAQSNAYLHLRNADPLTRDVPAQQVCLQELQKLLDLRVDLLLKAQELFFADRVAYGREIRYLVLRGHHVTENMRQQVREMSELEAALLKTKSENQEAYSTQSYILITCLGTIMLAIIISGFLMVKREYQQRQAAESARLNIMVSLQESEIRYRSLNEVSNDAIIIASQEGNIISWNKTAQSIFGYTFPEVQDQPFTLIMPSKYREIYRKRMRRFVERGNALLADTSGSRIETVGLHKSGKEFPMEVTLSHWKVGDQHFFSGVIRDITVQRKAQERLKAAIEELHRSNQDLEEFAYVASHDLQEPLRKIQAFGDRLVNQYKDSDSPGREYVTRMTDAAGRMQVLIQDLLAFSRVSRDAGNKTVVDLNQTVQHVLDDLQVAITESGAHVTVDDLPVLSSANITQMHQLFINLINNAIKFRKPGVPPEIRIESRSINGQSSGYNGAESLSSRWYYEITITDNGIGFDERYAEKIFTIFQRLHGRNEYKGTGIGLAVCRKICTHHGGFITAHSDGISGSVFTIVLPK